MSEEAMEKLEKIVSKIPKDQPFHLYLYQYSPDEGAIGNVKPFNRDGDILQQIKKTCIAEGLTGKRVVNVQIRGPQNFGKDGKQGSVQLDVILPDPPPPPPPPPPAQEQPRLPNPVAVDPVVELQQHKARMREIRAALEEDCPDCEQPESKCECRCDDPPLGCGLPLADCTCDDEEEEPSGFEKAFNETFVSGKGKQLMEEAGDEVLGILKGIGRRINGSAAKNATVSGGVKVVSRKTP